MSSRALRKAQREKEEQERLQNLEHDADTDRDQEDVLTSQPKKSMFDVLGQDDEDDPSEDEDHEEEQVESRRTDAGTTESEPRPSEQTRKKKNAKKKRKGAGGNGSTAQDAAHDMDEIDAALRQLSTTKNNAQSAVTASGVDLVLDEACRLLSVDTTHLHAQNEMRRLFGRAALEQDDDNEQAAQNAAAAGGGNRRQQRRQQHAGLAQALRGRQDQGRRAGGLGKLGLRRNLFVQGKEEWPLATGGGLGMEIVEKRADGTVEFRYVHNRAYQDVQSQFESCVASMDPNRLVVLLQHNPFHISTLLQVSEIAKSERDFATAGDLLERALFALGRAVQSTFAKSMSEGKARLDFQRPENREFWLAGWRYMQNLSMRGTWRTAYEWAKLLLSLAPEEDPYAIWLILDQYASRCREDLDYINLSRNASSVKVHKNMPQVQLGQGFAEYRSGNKSKGQQVLFTAIGRFPWVIARLMQELGLDPPPAVWGKEPRTEKEKLYSEMYATRAKDIWNTPETSSLLVETASAVSAEARQSDPDTSAIELNEARHVILSDTPSLIALIPRSFTSQLTSVSDPLPPSGNTTSYTATARQGAASIAQSNNDGDGASSETMRELEGLYRFFNDLFPWFDHVRGAAGNEGAEQTPPSEEEIERRIQESGVDEGVVIERTRRMVELQGRLLQGAGLPGVEPPAEAEVAEEVGHVLREADDLSNTLAEASEDRRGH